MNNPPTPGTEQHPHLLRRFGLLQATALNMTNMIGIGPFITIPALMSALHGPQAMLGWVVAVLITVPDALVWSELGAAMPGSGGSYVYIRDGFGGETFGRLMAFLLGLGAATRIGVYDYLGYYDVCFIGEEVKDPGKVIPRSIIISIVAVALIYVAINFSIIGVVPWREFVPASDPPAPVVSLHMEKIYGAKAAGVFTLMVLWTAFGSVFALLLGYSRIPY